MHYKRALAILEKAFGSDHPDVAIVLSNLAVMCIDRHAWSQAVEFLQRGTLVTAWRSKRGVETLGRLSRVSPKEGPSFELLVKASHRLAGTEPKRLNELAASTFQAAQWVFGSNAAVALTQMADRQAKSGGALARLVRERQDLVGEWQALDARLITVRSQVPDRRDAGAAQVLQTHLSGIDMRIVAIDERLAADFPDYTALRRPEPLSVADVQARLGAGEVLVLFLDTLEWQPIPEETFIWVVTKSDMRWVRMELGTKVLTERVAALRCGLDHTLWDSWLVSESAQRCKAALGAVPGVETAKVGDKDQNVQVLPFDRTRAHQLYQAMFGQVGDQIKGKHLLIVPSGPLTQIPFQVLVTEQPDPATKGTEAFRQAAWLAKSNSITILPAVSSLKALREHAKTSHATKPFVGFGNPLLDGDAEKPWEVERARKARDRQHCSETGVQRLAASTGARVGLKPLARASLAEIAGIRGRLPLPETTDELCAVALSLGVPESEIKLGARATETEVKALSADGRLADYRVVHFATHGAISGEIEGGAEPGLILTPPGKATNEDDGYLSASEIAGLKLDADWVILSACNTAAGGAESAEALSGMSRAFFYAGARALLVSHRAIDSDATVKLITRTVSSMVADKTVGRSEALRRSMVALIEQGEPHEAHPAYWAPFVVVGEGGAPDAIGPQAIGALPTHSKKTTRKSRPKGAEPWTVEIWKKH